MNTFKLHYILPMLAMISIIACSKPVPAEESAFEEMKYTPEKTIFSLWSPEADAVQVNIYQEWNAEEATCVIELTAGENGYWKGEVEKDLMNHFYAFQITYHGEKLQECAGVNARAVALNGHRGAIIDFKATNPEGWSKEKRPVLKNIDDIILYEVHHRDFTMDPESGIQHKGQYLAYTETGTTNSYGESTGIDHLVDLGITHLHILPSFDGAGDEVENSYNWGYDPLNYNVPEGKYSTDPSDPYARIREFKQMVQSLHAHGIRVVLDVVYNHTFSHTTSNFDLTAPKYFYRFNEDGTYSDGSGCGNETASEKEMMRKFMIESVLYWAREYHIDGFRFDLMGIHDIETMNQLARALKAYDQTIFIYGEGWSAGTCQYEQAELAMKAACHRMPYISAFGDELRDAVRGPFSDDSKGAFLCGENGFEQSIRFGLVGAIEHPDVDYTKVNYSEKPWATEPYQMISYVSCHDDMCLSDRLRKNLPENEAKDIAALKLGETIVLCSQGVPFIFCGEEVFRDKKQVHNSFCSPDEINSIEWERRHTYSDVYQYMKEMIAIRKAHKVFHMGSADAVRKYVSFLDSPEKSIVMHLDGMTIGDSWSSVYVVFNGSVDTPAKIKIPEGEYTVICQNGEISHLGLAESKGGEIEVAPTCAMILKK